MKAEEDRLRQQLQALLDEARANEKKFQRFDKFERALIAARSLTELIHVVLHSDDSALGTEAITLVLVDPEYEITRILESNKRGASEMPGLVILEKLFRDRAHPYLGRFDADMQGAIFDPWPCRCESMALLPLMRQAELIGSLNLGSAQLDRFSSSRGTFFLDRLAAILSICLENALNLERLKLVGLTDYLTGLSNRRYFEARCQEDIAHARRHNQPLACMFLDIDHFKHINDTFGHLTGDKVLGEIARLIRQELRNGDIVARYGGEEFVVLMPQTTSRHAHDIAERIRAALASKPVQPLPGKTIPVTLSIGISALPEKHAASDATVAQEMLGGADAALYKAKQTGRNRIVIWDAAQTAPLGAVVTDSAPLASAN